MRKILTDRHHADLLYSTQRLFEDRLGVDVWIPVGHEWWDEGYWRFGQVFGDDRLAQQYLVAHDGIWKPEGHGTYWTTDTAHPARKIRGITLAAARERDWSYVMPTVQENQAGFARFADEACATYLYQVGNVGQHVDWDLEPRVITSTALDIEGHDAVRYHQEIASGPGGTFAFSDPAHANPYAVRNFVNAFPRLPGFARFTETMERLGPDWSAHVHGHEGADGNLNPVGLIGAAMAGAGWGWQDKPTGDGFGHVIHGWAAVGRPIIGRASYYRGHLADPFWQHGVTCIDLDRVDVAGCVAMMREVAADARQYGAMCHAIRETFDSLVDYEAEARTVAAFLGLA
jgi:hypothetical protein